MKLLIRFTSIFVLSFFTLYLSPFADLEQLLFTDLRLFSFINPYNLNLGLFIVAGLVALLTNILLQFFKPFIDIYLMYYFKFSFYLLINLLSISTIFLVLRVYGYSRLNILIYLLLTSTTLYIEDKLSWK